MKEKNTNKADRAFLDVYPEETHPQEAEPSGQSVHAESALTPKRISAKMRRGTLEAYKQTFLVPAKLIELRAVYLSRATQKRVDFVVRRLGDRGPICRASWSASCAPRGMAKAVIQARGFVEESTNDVNAKHAVTI